MERSVFINGVLCAEKEARISIYDSALMYGDMIFEMTRSFQGTHFELTAHLNRLREGASLYEIEIPFSDEEICEQISELTEYHQNIFSSDDEHRLMINLTRGCLGIYSEADGVFTSPQLIISDFPLRWTVGGFSQYYLQGGVDACVVPITLPATTSIDCRVKSRSRVHYMRANQYASRQNAWPILLDAQGFVGEGSGFNIFIVKSGCLYTPAAHGILKGVSRDYVISLAEANGTECVETKLTMFDLETADEVFFTATPFCIMPVKRLAGREFNDNSLSKFLIKKWSDSVGLDFVEQIRLWDSEARTLASSVKSSPYLFKK